MPGVDINVLAESVATMLISHAAHGVSTSSLQGIGEITLRDGLVASAASVGSRLRQSWIINREFTPSGWSNTWVDLVVTRRVGNGVRLVAGTELKWWRQDDGANAGNRRKELVRDFLRAAALYAEMEGTTPALVSLLATQSSWEKTSRTQGADRFAMSLIRATGRQEWRSSSLSTSPAFRNAAKELVGKVPVANIFRSEQLRVAELKSGDVRVAIARVWKVWKHQNTKFLTASEIAGF